VSPGAERVSFFFGERPESLTPVARIEKEEKRKKKRIEPDLDLEQGRAYQKEETIGTRERRARISLTIRAPPRKGDGKEREIKFRDQHQNRRKTTRQRSVRPARPNSRLEKRNKRERPEEKKGKNGTTKSSRITYDQKAMGSKPRHLILKIHLGS